MPKRGIEYLLSPQKRAFEWYAGRLIQGAAETAGSLIYKLVARELNTADPDEIILRQERLGQAGAKVITEKFYTLPKTKECSSVDLGAHRADATPLGDKLRRSGGDEVLQAKRLSMGRKPRPGMIYSVSGYREMLERDVLANAKMLQDPSMRDERDFIDKGIRLVPPGLLGYAQLLGHYRLPATELSREVVRVEGLKRMASYFNPDHPAAASLYNDTKILWTAVFRVGESAVREAPAHLFRDDALLEQANRFQTIVANLA